MNLQQDGTFTTVLILKGNPAKKYWLQGRLPPTPPSLDTLHTGQIQPEERSRKGSNKGHKEKGSSYKTWR